MVTCEILVSQDVIFHEKVFPFLEENSTGQHDGHAKYEFFGNGSSSVINPYDSDEPPPQTALSLDQESPFGPVIGPEGLSDSRGDEEPRSGPAAPIAILPGSSRDE